MIEVNYVICAFQDSLSVFLILYFALLQQELEMDLRKKTFVFIETGPPICIIFTLNDKTKEYSIFIH